MECRASIAYHEQFGILMPFERFMQMLSGRPGSGTCQPRPAGTTIGDQATLAAQGFYLRMTAT